MEKKIVDLIFEAIDEINKQRPLDDPVEKSVNIVLLGEKSKFDSFEIVNFIVAVEQKIQEEFDIPIILTDDITLSEEKNPLANVKELAEHILLLLNKKNEH